VIDIALEHFLSDTKLIGVIDTLIVNEDTEPPVGSRLTVEELAQLSNTTKGKIRSVKRHQKIKGVKNNV
jgi:hypothetical protein